MFKIAVAGTGYVGLVAGVCFAEVGHKVICVDIDEAKVESMKKGVSPIYEDDLEELMQKNYNSGRLDFTTDYKAAYRDADAIFIGVGTPEQRDGSANLSHIAKVARQIAETIEKDCLVVVKSTVPVGTGDWVADIVKRSQPKPIDFSVVSCPEFLREGSAISDFSQPHRTVLGSTDRDAANKVAQLHLPLRAPIVITDLRTAEMIKYASNAFLATKISFINEISDICEALGADVKEVAAGMGYDARIGRHFLDAGLGWGGSCFPKDVLALAYMAEEAGLDPRILNTVMDVNYERRKTAVEHVKTMVGGELKGKTIGLLGLAFKPNTDDMRDAPAIDIAEELNAAGATVHGYDPVAMGVARGILPAVEMFKGPYEMAKGCDALMVVTEWNEFKQLDLEKLKGLLNTPVIYDGRNIYDPTTMRSLGFTYRAIGR